MGVLNNANPQGLSRGTIIACIVLTVVGFLVYTGHGAHMLGFFPYLLILACPLMHLFMHGGPNDKEQVNTPKGNDSKGDHS